MSNRKPPEPNMIDDTRRAREEVSKDGFNSIRNHLNRVREQRRQKTGPFADLPDQQPADVRELIEKGLERPD